MDNQRFLLVIALGIILFMIFQAWQEEQRVREAPPETATAPETQATAPQEVPPAPEVPSPAPTPTAPAPTTEAPAPPAPAAASSGRVKVVTDLLEATIDLAGGDLRVLKLLDYPVSVDQPDNPFVLMNDSGSEALIAQSGLIGADREYPNHRSRYTTAAQRYALGDKQELKVPLRWDGPDGVRYTKTYTFDRDSYVIDVEYEVENASTKPWQGFLYRQFRRHHKASKRGWLALPTYTGAAIYTPADKYDKIDFDDMREQPLDTDVDGGWVAMLQHYFVGAWMPPADERNRFYSKALQGNNYIIGLKNLQPATIAPGASGRLKTTLYAGPKEHERLKKLAEGMELTVDYGWLTFLSAPLFWLLSYIHNWVGNWGWAIIVLTVLIKLVFYPLSAASYKSMAHMKRVQPKLQSLRERFGHDKQRMNQAMMDLYKKEKINPLGGCLPIVIQIPVFIALYWVLLESVEMRQAPFIFWIRDLSVRDPFFVLPIIMGISMFVQQKLAPAQLDPMQRRLMNALPIVFTVFFLFFPAGLVLYWVVNNILSIAQQWQITRMIEGKAKAT
ncbi:MAG: membrane protein insertase YidC [Acidiferrobacterales bacterium]